MNDAFVVGIGAFGPLGLDARQCALVTRASKLTPRPTNFRDSHGSRMANSRAPSLSDGLYGFERLLALAEPALKEAVADADCARPDAAMPLFLALPEPRPDDDERYGRGFIEMLAARTGVPIDVSASSYFRAGAVGMAAALERASANVGALGRGEGMPVLVGAVDSYHHPDVLAWLDREKRLLSGVVHDGFVPSEGAAFAVLAGSRHRGTRLAKLTDVAVAKQPPPEPDDRKNGEAFSDLVRRMASTSSSPLPWVLPDVNGERHRVNEWMVTKIRNDDLLTSDDTIEERLADQAGDCGAAAGAFALTYVTEAFRLGFAKKDSALVMLSSESLERGCFMLERP